MFGYLLYSASTGATSLGQGLNPSLNVCVFSLLESCYQHWDAFELVDSLVTLATSISAEVRSDCVAPMGNRSGNLKDSKRGADKAVPPDFISVSRKSSVKLWLY